MGRNDLLTEAEVAEKLGVNPWTVKHLVRSGTLVPVHPPWARGEKRFRAQEIQGLMEAREKKRGLPEVTSSSYQALSLSRSVADRLDELFDLLGIHYRHHPTDEDSVMGMYLEAKEELDAGTVGRDPWDVMRWAHVINAVDEHYLRVVELHTGDPDPWAPFYALAQKMAEEAPFSRLEIDRDVAITYGHLEAARKNIRHVAFFYVWHKDGMKSAKERFPDGDPDEEIIAHLILNPAKRVHRR